MSVVRLHVVVPGPIDQQTGGYIYDRRMVDGLRARGWQVAVHSLAGAFPATGAGARERLAAALAGLPDGARVVIDGLALGGLPGPVRAERARLRILALVHHPLADETGLDAPRRAKLEALEREALAACAGVLVTSTFTARRLEAWGVAPVRVRAVLPGTDPAPLAEGPEPGAPPAAAVGGVGDAAQGPAPARGGPGPARRPVVALRLRRQPRAGIRATRPRSRRSRARTASSGG